MHVVDLPTLLNFGCELYVHLFDCFSRFCRVLLLSDCKSVLVLGLLQCDCYCYYCYYYYKAHCKKFIETLIRKQAQGTCDCQLRDCTVATDMSRTHWQLGQTCDPRMQARSVKDALSAILLFCQI